MFFNWVFSVIIFKIMFDYFECMGFEVGEILYKEYLVFDIDVDL